MTTPHRTLQMALDALDAITDDVDGTGLNTMPSFDKALDAIAALRSALEAPEPEPVAWEGGEEWEQLAWHLCAAENGEDACNELIWEGGPIKEPWGERWLKYEGEAKRMIALVRKYAAPPAAPDHFRDVAEKVAPAAPLPDGLATNADEVICPNCAHQFRAIPENVQSLLLASGHEPPFTASPAAPVVPLPRPGPLGLIQYAGSDMQEYAAAVSAAKDAEIERLLERAKALYGGTMRQAAEIAQLRTELLVSLADNKGLRAEVAGLREFVEHVRRNGGTHLAGMAIAVLAALEQKP